MQRISHYIRDAFVTPVEQLTRGQSFIVGGYRLTRFAWTQLARHRAEGMAAELSYRTIFSLVPLVVLGLVTFRIVGGLDEIQQQIEEPLYSFFGVPEITEGYEQSFESDLDSDDDLGDASSNNNDGMLENLLETAAAIDQAGDGVQIEGDVVDERGEAISQSDADGSAVTGDSRDTDETPNDDLNSDDSNDGDESSDSGSSTQRDRQDRAKDAAIARASIRKTLQDVTMKVSDLDFRSIGVVGLVVFMYAAVALAVAVEDIFNRIYEAPEGRPMHIRVAIHWSIVTLGSGLLAMSLYLSNQAVAWFNDVAGSSGGWLAAHFVSALASWVLLFLLYALMPHVHVSVRAAAIGSGVAAFLWEAAKFGFQIYVTRAVPYSALYGSIGLIPLFLFWIYVTWLLVLFGLVLTHSIQMFRGGFPETSEDMTSELPPGDPDWMLPIVTEVGRKFQTGQTVTPQDVADQLGLTSRVVQHFARPLIEHKIIRRVASSAGEEDSLCLARPAETIAVADVLNLAHVELPRSPQAVWQTLRKLKQAEREAAGQTTLAELIESTETNACDNA